MKRLTTKQIDERIAKRTAEIEELNNKREIAVLYDQIAELEKKSKPKRKYVRRKPKVADTGMNPAPQQGASEQTPDETTQQPPKTKRTRRTKAEMKEAIKGAEKIANNHSMKSQIAEEEQDFEESSQQQRFLYHCKNGHEFDEPKLTNKGKAQCPICFTYEIEANED